VTTDAAKGDAAAAARRDRAAATVSVMDGVTQVTGSGTQAQYGYGTRVVALTVTMSPQVDASQVAAVLDAASSSSTATGPDKWLPQREVVTTLVTGDVRFTWTGGTNAQAMTLVGLRDDPQVRAATITLTHYDRPVSGSGTVTVTTASDAQAVQASWESRLRSTFLNVHDWQFTA
jgi:hypothetical protein